MGAPVDGRELRRSGETSQQREEEGEREKTDVGNVANNVKSESLSSVVAPALRLDELGGLRPVKLLQILLPAGREQRCRLKLSVDLVVVPFLGNEVPVLVAAVLDRLVVDRSKASRVGENVETRFVGLDGVDGLRLSCEGRTGKVVARDDVAFEVGEDLADRLGGTEGEEGVGAVGGVRDGKIAHK